MISVPRTRKQRILIVDDDQNILEVISTGLQDAGYLVDTARNANEAVEKSGTNFYNLALVDIRLPDIEGIKLLARLKEARPEMITIILTGYPTLQNAVEAVNNGADAYLLKPVRMNDILEVVRGKLKKQEELYLYVLDE
jgi:DNA-binding NtrC family response regulator